LKEHSGTENFILKMGMSKERIPIVYTESKSEIAIKREDGKISSKSQRYENGSDIVFKCSKCKEYIAKGKRTNEKEDKAKLFCFNCKDRFSYDGVIIWSKDPLWVKQQMQPAKDQYDDLIRKFIEENKPEIVEL
jgi:hypothetical protein